MREYRPIMDQVLDYKACGKYDVLPVSCEIMSDFITPIEAIRILKNVSSHCYLLESAKADETWGRYTFLGYDPKMEITVRDGVFKAGSLTVETKDPSKYLRQILSEHRRSEPVS